MCLQRKGSGLRTFLPRESSGVVAIVTCRLLWSLWKQRAFKSVSSSCWYRTSQACYLCSLTLLPFAFDKLLSNTLGTQRTFPASRHAVKWHRWTHLTLITCRHHQQDWARRLHNLWKACTVCSCPCHHRVRLEGMLCTRGSSQNWQLQHAQKRRRQLQISLSLVPWNLRLLPVLCRPRLAHTCL